jgi:16S rRNA (uracil1498-N3)-methyltransferase
MSAPAVYLDAGLTTLPASSPWYRTLTRVVRVRPGEAVRLLDGLGGERLAVVTAVDREGVRFEVRQSRCVERAEPALVLGQALLPANRFDDLVQQATELGVDVVQPLLSARTNVRLEPADVPDKLERWQRKAREAVRQCGRALEPEIRPPLTLSEWLGTGDATTSWVLFDRGGSPELPPLSPIGDVRLVIGPEGGWDASEVATLRARGGHVVELGPHILRAETAALLAVGLAARARGTRSGG